MWLHQNPRAATESKEVGGSELRSVSNEVRRWPLREEFPQNCRPTETVAQGVEL